MTMFDHSSGTDGDRAQSIATEPPKTPSPPDTPSQAPGSIFRTPISNKASSTILPTLSHSLTEQAFKDGMYDKKIAKEMDEVTVEVDYATFMRLASGKSTKSLTSAQLKKIGRLSRLGEVGKEWEMYPILCDRLNKVLQLAGTDQFIVKDVAEWRESDTVDHRPDIGIYPTHEKAAIAYSDDTKTRVHASRIPHRARVAWAWLECFGELKHDIPKSGYHFEKGKGLLRQTFLGTQARAQVTTFATELMYRQHRTHLFTFYILKTHARLMRWDRTGLIISEPIDLVKSPRAFLNFFYRMATMTREELGYDTTAVLASAAEIKLFQELQLSNEHANAMLTHATANQNEWPIYKIQCPTLPLDANGNIELTAAPSEWKAKSYLVGKPTTYCCSPTGRATKGYVTLDIEQKRLVFLKDVWRANTNRIHPELDTYILLNGKGVCNVPTVLGGGDVNGSSPQCTLTQEYIKKHTAPVERLHCRLVLKELGRPLDTYADSVELILAVTDVFEAHSEAWEKAKILHRDISVANILIDVEPTADGYRGLLVDWDLCKYQDELGSGPTQPGGRSGTWPYLSALALQYPKKPIELADDLESFVYVLTYCALRFHQHNLCKAHYAGQKTLNTKKKLADNNLRKNTKLAQHVFLVFYEESDEDGFMIGGDQKLQNIELSRPSFTLATVEKNIVPLARLIGNMYTLLHEHYAALDLDKLQSYKPQIQTTIRPKTTEGSGSISRNRLLKRLSKTDSVMSPHSTRNAIPTRVVAWTKDTPPSRVLDNHEKMREVLWNVWTEFPGGIAAALEVCEGDKTLDQLYGVVQFLSHRPIGASAGTKHEADEASATPPAKHRRLNDSSVEALVYTEEEDSEGSIDLESRQSDSDLTDLEDLEEKMRR